MAPRPLSRTAALIQAGRAPYGVQADMIAWWRTVAASRALPARAEVADQLSADLALAMAATGTAEPELAAASAVAAWRTVHLEAMLAGEDGAKVAARYPRRIRAALSAVDQMMPMAYARSYRLITLTGAGSAGHKKSAYESSPARPSSLTVTRPR